MKSVWWWIVTLIVLGCWLVVIALFASLIAPSLWTHLALVVVGIGIGWEAMLISVHRRISKLILRRSTP